MLIEIPVEQLFVTRYIHSYIVNKLFPGCLGWKKSVMGPCTLGVLSLGVVGKTKCLAGGLIVSGLGGCTGFLQVEANTGIFPRFSGVWKAFITFLV